MIQRIVIQGISTLGLPLMLLIGGLLVASYPRELPAIVHASLPPLAALLLMAVLVLAILFNRSRVLFLMAFVTLLYLLLGLPLPWNELARNRDALHQLLCLITPIYFMLFPWLAERGLLTRAGMIRFGLLLFPMAIVLWLTANQSGAVWSLLTTPIHPFLTAVQTPLPQLSIGLFVLSASLQLFRVLRYWTHLELGFLMTVIGIGAALHNVSHPIAFSLLVTTIALIMTISLIRESHTMAYRDQLTGLPARRALQEDLLKLGSRYVIAMLDVDHFKRFNDTYGHDVGDQVLKLVASRLKAVTGGGKAARYGGEEFTVLFPGKTIEQVSEHAERLREAVAASSFQLRRQDRPKEIASDKAERARKGTKQSGDTSVSVTISIGLAERTPEQSQPEDVMKAADAALYRAKDAGRNRVSR